MQLSSPLEDCGGHTSSREGVRYCRPASPCGVDGRLSRPSQKARCLTEPSKCVAAGEVGLDYHTHSHGSRQERREQQDYLRRFLPQVSHLPVVLHCRPSDTHPHQARVDLLELMQEVGVSRDAKIYIHSFCGDESDVRAWMSAYPRSHFGMGKNSPQLRCFPPYPLIGCFWRVMRPTSVRPLQNSCRCVGACRPG